MIAEFQQESGINDDFTDVLFSRNTSGQVPPEPLFYDASAETLTTGSPTTLVGFADQSVGTFTPTFTNAGTVNLSDVSTYSKTGKTVTLWWNGDIAASSSASALLLQPASLPFAISASYGLSSNYINRYLFTMPLLQ